MTDKFFPFHRLGFRSNPFRSLTDDEWSAIAILPQTVLDALRDGVWHLQLLGPMGVGKSTTLLGLAQHLGAIGQHVEYEYLAHGQQRFVTNTPALDVLLLDEAQRLSWRERKRLLNLIKRHALRVVFSSHEDLTTLFARSGVSLSTVELAQASLEQRTEMIQRRLEFFALDTPLVTVAPSAVEWLVAHYGPNQRACDALLYEVFQHLDLPCSITDEDVQAEFVHTNGRQGSG